MDRCEYRHPSWEEFPEYHGTGQNIFAAGGYKPSIGGAVGAWYNEVKHYTLATHKCTGVCGHYTQVRKVSKPLVVRVAFYNSFVNLFYRWFGPNPTK